MSKTYEQTLLDEYLKKQQLKTPLYPALSAALNQRFYQAMLEDVKKQLAHVIKNQLKHIQSQPFCWIDNSKNEHIFLLETEPLNLWAYLGSRAENYLMGKLTGSGAELENVRSLANRSIHEVYGWHLPSGNEMVTFAKRPGNPMRRGEKYRLLDFCYWLIKEGRIDLDEHYIENLADANAVAYILPLRNYAQKPEKLLQLARQQQWKIRPCTNESIDLLDTIGEIRINQPVATTALQTLDSYSLPLPDLETADISDPAKGIWELWGADQASLQKQGLRARNPVQDIKHWNIAIDFGTSSTVVAYQENGRKKLLRIGVKDFWQENEPAHYENPTVLEFVDLPKALAVWQQQAYRPQLKWGDMRCSHEAQARLRDNEGDPAVTASILGKLKHWALRIDSDSRIKITDQTGKQEMELPPMALLNPVKGQPLVVSPDKPFDPVELYAWYLGMTINWRKRGLFLHYYMTFPVAYPRDVKEKILAAFRRGLQRSLPESLIKQPEFNDFTVEERASEPAAFAAAALPFLNIHPTAEGVAYAVFDFGGGTTDFDFGIYRLPTDAELDEGYETVFEHFGASGDRFLGGENLLENLAYRVFRHNLDVCRNKKIAFTRPLDADDFPGSEMVLEKTQAALTNTQMLMARLRKFWEYGARNSNEIEKITLINRSGDEAPCDLAIPYELLAEYLQQRMLDGIKSFFTAMHRAFAEADNQPGKIHLLLAGNASQSVYLRAIFDLADTDKRLADKEDTLCTLIKTIKTAHHIGDAKNPETIAASGNLAHQALLEYLTKLYGDEAPEFIVHPPILKNPKDPYQPTTKTGVALGLLDLCPGSTVKVINHAGKNSGGEAPFAWYVGRIQKNSFLPLMKRHAAYHQWVDLGPVREGVFNLVYTQSPMANTGEMAKDDQLLSFRRVTVNSQNDKCHLFARVTGPASIEVCGADNEEQLKQNGIALQQIDLDS